jgi:ABC-type Na+ efflux pump permease subunit
MLQAGLKASLGAKRGTWKSGCYPKGRRLDLLFGPIFSRELLLTPRRPRFYIIRAAYCLGLVLLIATAWLVLTGTQVVDTVGALARFGGAIFHILAPLQLVVTTFFAALLTASSVAQEKDRQTLDLLLVTRLSNAELVLGKLLASLIIVVVLVIAALPIFSLLCLFGGISFAQIGRVTLVSLGSVLVAGSIGCTMGFWREKTFQALAGTTLGLVAWVGIAEAMAAGAVGRTIWGIESRELAAWLSPWQAIVSAAQAQLSDAVARPWNFSWLGREVSGFLLFSFGVSAILNGIAVARVRRWARATEPRPVLPEPERPGPLSATVQRAAFVGTAAGDCSYSADAPGQDMAQVAAAENQVPLVGSTCGTLQAGEVSTGWSRGEVKLFPHSSEETGSESVQYLGQIAAEEGSRPLTSSQEQGIAAWRWHRKAAEAAVEEAGGLSFGRDGYRPWWLDVILPPGAKTVRGVWSNPILWREICTRAYGRRMIVLRLGYLLIFAALAWWVHSMLGAGMLAAEGLGGLAVAAFFLLSLVLVNTQAVSSLIAERDGRTLDLLLVTDITPREFVFGKMAGTFFNAKEMVVLPLALCFYLWWQRAITGLELFYLLVGLAVLFGFVAMLGLHVGMIYDSSRQAIAVSLGTVFFLFVGVATCIWMMVAFSGRFEAQLPFLGLIVFGGAALYLALGVRNPSTAIGLASFACPLMTFYAISSFFLQQPHLVFVTVVVGYGFATLAMLIPAIDEFDVATGRTTVEE